MIESQSNKAAKLIKSLKISKYRERERLFLAEGVKFVSEIPFSWKVEFFAVSESFKRQNKKEVDRLYKKGQVIFFSDSAFKALCDTENPQGIIAVCRQKKFDINDVLKLKNGFYVIVEELNDPGNLGTIIRTADAAGAGGVFITKGSVDLYNPKVLRSTMGSIFHLPVISGVEVGDVISEMHNRHIKVFAAHLKGKTSLYSINLKDSFAFVIGNEARGISAETENLTDKLIKIPMIGKAESLNASVAASVVMYEALRQRLK